MSDDLMIGRGGPSMKDTTPEFRELVRARFAGMTPEERVLACIGMFDTARALRLCERFYGDLARRAYPARPG
jgi:hypothetical protein